jgi:hypothetical protein
MLIVEAIVWLREMLADGPLSASEVLTQAERMGFKRGTLQRAKECLKIQSNKVGFKKGWYWSLPSTVEDPSKMSIQLETESSAKNRLQHTDYVEDSSKIHTPLNLRTNKNFEKPRRSNGCKSSGESKPHVDLEAVKPPKIHSPTILKSSSADIIFDADDEVII